MSFCSSSRRMSKFSFSALIVESIVVRSWWSSPTHFYTFLFKFSLPVSLPLFCISLLSLEDFKFLTHLALAQGRVPGVQQVCKLCLAFLWQSRRLIAGCAKAIFFPNNQWNIPLKLDEVHGLSQELSQARLSLAPYELCHDAQFGWNLGKGWETFIK